MSDNASERLAIRVLGGFEVCLGDRVLIGDDFQRRKPIDLIKLLAIAPTHRLSRDDVIERLWPGMAPGAGANNLYKSLHYIRREVAGANTDLVSLERHSVSLGPSVTVDLDEFRSAAVFASGRGAVESYEEALSLYRGVLLPDDMSAEWSEAERYALLKLVLRLRTELAEAYVRDERPDRAIDLLQMIVNDDPTHEETHRGLMRLYAATGREDRALRQYDICVRTLHEQLDVGPGSETRELANSIRSQRLIASSGTARDDVSDLVRQARQRFVGRAAEVESLGAALREAAAEHGSAVVLSGEPGIGKTALLEHFAATARASGAVVAMARCGAQGAPYQPFIEVIRQLAGSSPADETLPSQVGLKKAEIARLPAEPSKERLVGAVLQFIADSTRDRPAVLILDDIHWADQGTLTLLQALIEGITASRLLLLLGCRAPEVSEMLRRLPAVAGEHRLAGLDQKDLEELVASWAGYDVPRSFTSALMVHTEGNPFYAYQLMQHLRESDIAYRRGSSTIIDSTSIAAIGMTAGIADVLSRRYYGMPATSRMVLSHAAILGEPCSAERLSSLCGSSEAEARKAIDLSLVAGWLSEGASRDYTIRHDLMRRFIEDELSSTQRREIHLRAGELLEREAAESGDESPAQLAAITVHYRGAGPNADPAKRLRYELAAGQAAMQIFAWETVVDHWREAHRLMEDAGAPPIERARLLERIGDAMFQGDLDAEAGIAILEQALAIYRAAGDEPRAARVQSRLGMRLGGAPGDYTYSDIPRAVKNLEEAHRFLVSQGDSAPLGYAMVGMASAYLWQRRAHEALEVLRETLAMADRMQDRRLHDSALPLLAHALQHTDQPREALATIEEAWRCADAADDAFLAHLSTFVFTSVISGSAADRIAWCERELGKDRMRYARQTRQTLLHILAASLVMAGNIERARQVADELSQHGYGRRMLLMHDGQWQELRGIYEAEAERSLRGGNIYNWSNSVLELGTILELQGRDSEAAGLYKELLARNLSSAFELVPRARLVNIYALGGDVERAMMLKREREEAFEAGPGGSFGGELILSRGVLSEVHGDVTSARRDCDEALRLLGSRSYLMHANALTLWARAMLQAGRADEAKVKLDEAAALYTSVGAGQPFIDGVDRLRPIR